MINEYWFTDADGATVFTTFNPKQRMNADHVLLYAFSDEEILLTRHRRRGIELPGGKRELGEEEEEAVIREAWEETGVRITQPLWIGQYTVNGTKKFTKSIWYARIQSEESLPPGFETEGKVLLREWPDPFYDERYSRIMRDLNFYLVKAHLIHRKLVPTNFAQRSGSISHSVKK